eukprot:RCo040103
MNRWHLVAVVVLLSLGLPFFSERLKSGVQRRAALLFAPTSKQNSSSMAASRLSAGSLLWLSPWKWIRGHKENSSRASATRSNASHVWKFKPGFPLNGSDSATLEPDPLDSQTWDSSETNGSSLQPPSPYLSPNS